MINWIKNIFRRLINGAECQHRFDEKQVLDFNIDNPQCKVCGLYFSAIITKTKTHYRFIASDTDGEFKLQKIKSK